MSWDSEAASDRQPEPAIPDDRVERMIASTLARLDTARVLRPARSDWRVWLLDLLPALAPASRFAMPMAAAALLGIVVGQQLQAE